MKKITVFLNKTLQLLAVAAMLSVTVNANAAEIRLYLGENASIDPSGLPDGFTYLSADGYINGFVSEGSSFFFPTPTAMGLERNDPEGFNTFMGWTISGGGLATSWNASTGYNSPSYLVGSESIIRFDAWWANVSGPTTPIDGGNICQEEGTYVIEGTVLHALDMVATGPEGVISGPGTTLTPGSSDADPATFTVTYPITSSGPKSITIQFFNNNELCGDEIVVEFVAVPSPTFEAEPICVSDMLGSINIKNDPAENSTDYRWQIVPPGGTYISDPTSIAWVEYGTLVLTNLPIVEGETYDIYKLDFINNTHCIGKESVELAPCCPAEIEVTITKAGKKEF